MKQCSLLIGYYINIHSVYKPMHSCKYHPVLYIQLNLILHQFYFFLHSITKLFNPNSTDWTISYHDIWCPSYICFRSIVLWDSKIIWQFLDKDKNKIFFFALHKSISKYLAKILTHKQKHGGTLVCHLLLTRRTRFKSRQGTIFQNKNEKRNVWITTL